MWKGIGKERDTHPFLTKTAGFDTNPSRKGTQRNPPVGNPHSGDGIPFFPLWENRILFFFPQKEKRNARKWPAAVDGRRLLVVPKSFSQIFFCHHPNSTSNKGGEQKRAD